MEFVAQRSRVLSFISCSLGIVSGCTTSGPTPKSNSPAQMHAADVKTLGDVPQGAVRAGQVLSGYWGEIQLGPDGKWLYSGEPAVNALESPTHEGPPWRVGIGFPRPFSGRPVVLASISGLDVTTTTDVSARGNSVGVSVKSVGPDDLWLEISGAVDNIRLLRISWIAVGDVP